MRTLIATVGVLLGLSTPALAGTYVNIEANSAYTGSNYESTVIDNHVGFEGDNWYLQGGPSIVTEDAGDSDLELSGKAGGSLSLSESVSLYGELSFMTGDEDNSYGTKAGVKFNF